MDALFGVVSELADARTSTGRLTARERAWTDLFEEDEEEAELALLARDDAELAVWLD